VLWVRVTPLDGELALGTHWVMKEFSRIMVIICFVGLGFVFGVVLWVVGVTLGVIDYNMSHNGWSPILVTLLPVSSITTVLGGFIGYRVSRLIK